jgi:hypothetical protein
MEFKRRLPRMMLLTLVLSFLAPRARAVAGPEGLDQALCGPPTRADEPDKLARLESDSPPILDQAPTSWCYAFSATDVLNYYIHKTNGTPYDDAHLLSPIDAVAAQRYYDDQYHLGTLSDPPGHISVKSGGNPYDVFIGVQELPAMRSAAQVPFSSSGSSDPAIRALVKQIKRDEKREEEDGGDPAEVSKEIKTFRIVNGALFSAAKEKQWTDPDGETLDHYHDLIQTLAGPPDLKIPPFTAEVYKTEDPVRYLNKVRDTLASGYPMNVSITTTDVFPELLKNGRKPGGEHAMTVVGSGYEGGACTVRLRNSWGIKSKHGRPGKGYVDLPVGRFLAAVGDYAILKNKAASYKIEWISAPDAQGPREYVGKLQRLVGYQGDGTEYYGRSIQHIRDNHKVKFAYVEGTHRAKDGSLKIYANGALHRVERLPASKGGVYTGEVTERETTPDHYKISYVKGVMEYPDGRRVTYPKD